MNLKDLQALGAFVSSKPIKRTVEVSRPVMLPEDEWEDSGVPEFTGDHEAATLDIYLKRTSSADEIAIAQAPADQQPFVIVCRLVRNADGSPLFESVEQASGLATWVLGPILAEIDSFTGYRPKKPSPPKTSSGSKSRSRSGVAARKSGKSP